MMNGIVKRNQSFIIYRNKSRPTLLICKLNALGILISTNIISVQATYD